MVYLTPKEIDDFRNGATVSKLAEWDLTREEFEAMILSGQIRIISED